MKNRIKSINTLTPRKITKVKSCKSLIFQRKFRTILKNYLTNKVTSKKHYKTKQKKTEKKFQVACLQMKVDQQKANTYL